MNPATACFSPAATGGVVPRSTTTARWGAANAGRAALRFSLDAARQGPRLRLSRAAPGRSAPAAAAEEEEEEEWWWLPLLPEDLVEPTGKGVEELVAIRDALLRDPLRPIWLAAQEIAATGGNIFRCRCFHAGIVTGSLLLVAGLCQLHKVAPNLFLDIVLAFIFYKLSVLAAELKRSVKDNTICARIQFVLIVILYFKCNNPIKDSYYHFTEFIWHIAFVVYSYTVMSECFGDKYARQGLEVIFRTLLTTKGGLIKMIKYCFRNKLDQ